LDAASRRGLLGDTSKEKSMFAKELMAIAAASAAIVTTTVVQAEEEKPLGLNGRVGFSYAEARGNTDTLAVSGDSTLEYVTGGPWLYDAKLLFVSREEGDVSTEERYEARLTANYYWTPEDYFYGRLDWRKDNFGGVREEWVPSAGYGRVILKNERHDLRGELGAGYRFADLADGSSEEGPVISGGLRYVWKISDTAEFYQNALVQWSDDNTYAESETGLRTAIIGNLNARISYLVKHNTDVPQDRANTDFFTTIGLEYQF
jgi:putative salt-induced outer membrane protein